VQASAIAWASQPAASRESGRLGAPCVRAGAVAVVAGRDVEGRQPGLAADRDPSTDGVPELAAARRVVETCELLLARVDDLRAKV
jgi:hypothetical protein